MFHTFADVKTAEDLKLPTPDLAPRPGDELRQPAMLAVDPSPELREYIQDIGERVDRIQQKLVDAEEDNMLKVSADGRKAALDMRLVDPALFQHGPTKISATADLLAQVYEQHKDRTYTDPATGDLDPVPGALQIVFCDFGTPSVDQGAFIGGADPVPGWELTGRAYEWLVGPRRNNIYRVVHC